ncbi:MAG TPA: TrbI/VirB10 family protein [Albidovulum sp.]|uniref:TrbI/VirB10 family protein n=1 Tax=Albidovulum sp. TaxID=1872424 RepID=UPI002BBB7A1E|nr:TrbI/VirB10 family protein [Albidovulum sp.]
MSDTSASELERRLKALEQNDPRRKPAPRRRTPLLAILITALVLLAGAVLWLMSGSEDDTALPTATPDEFQIEGEGFGAIEPVVPPPAPVPKVVEATPPPATDAALLAEIDALKAEIEALKRTPAPAGGNDPSATAAIEALTARIASLQTASEEAQKQFQEALAARDRELKQLRADLDLALIEAQNSALTPPDKSDADHLAREEEARRLAELASRAEEARAFEARRIASPLIAFGGAGVADANKTELSERRFDAATEFVMADARPSEVTRAEVIANPANTVIQGTMIQAVMETALDSSLPGQTRAIVSEDVFGFDGSRLLIPRGARLIGRYRSGVKLADRRITIAWDRIVLPSGQTVRISSFGGDDLGRSGVTGRVDTRFGARFGSAALISVISAAPGIAAGQVGDEEAADVLEDVGGDLADATDSVVGDYLAIGPVIHVAQGARVTVMVDRDLEIY